MDYPTRKELQVLVIQSMVSLLEQSRGSFGVCNVKPAIGKSLDLITTTNILEIRSEALNGLAIKDGIFAEDL